MLHLNEEDRDMPLRELTDWRNSSSRCLQNKRDRHGEGINPQHGSEPPLDTWAKWIVTRAKSALDACRAAEGACRAVLSAKWQARRWCLMLMRRKFRPHITNGRHCLINGRYIVQCEPVAWGTTRAFNYMLRDLVLAEDIALRHI